MDLTGDARAACPRVFPTAGDALDSPWSAVDDERRPGVRGWYEMPPGLMAMPFPRAKTAGSGEGSRDCGARAAKDDDDDDVPAPDDAVREPAFGALLPCDCVRDTAGGCMMSSPAWKQALSPVPLDVA